MHEKNPGGEKRYFLVACIQNDGEDVHLDNEGGKKRRGGGFLEISQKKKGSVFTPKGGFVRKEKAIRERSVLQLVKKRGRGEKSVLMLGRGKRRERD